MTRSGTPPRRRGKWRCGKRCCGDCGVEFDEVDDRVVQLHDGQPRQSGNRRRCRRLMSRAAALMATAGEASRSTMPTRPSRPLHPVLAQSVPADFFEHFPNVVRWRRCAGGAAADGGCGGGARRQCRIPLPLPPSSTFFLLLVCRLRWIIATAAASRS